ncbi:hypothetical protein D3C85_1891860 [compost metagenome]
MPQVLLRPAKVRPAPTKAARPYQPGCSQVPRAQPSRIRLPAQICTWRCRLITPLSAWFSGMLQATQASVPPSTT